MEIGTGAPWASSRLETPVDRGRNTSITCHGYVFRHISPLSSLSFFLSTSPTLFLSLLTVLPFLAPTWFAPTPRLPFFFLPSTILVFVFTCYQLIAAIAPSSLLYSFSRDEDTLQKSISLFLKDVRGLFEKF